MITSQFLVVGNGTRGTFQLIEYFSSQKLEYTSIPLAAWREFEFSGDEKDYIVFICTDAKHEREAYLALPNLARLGVPCIAVHDSGNEAFQTQAVEMGAIDVLSLPIRHTDIEDVLDIAFYQKEIGQHQSAMKDHAKQLTRLSPRERRIVCLAARGMPNKQIARAIGLSVKSVERLRRQAYEKLDVRSTADMTRVVLLGSLFECRGPHFLPERVLPSSQAVL